MSRTRRIISSFLPGRRKSGDGGFSLIEVMVALGLLVTVMATTAGFFTSSLKESNGQTQAQQAAVLADQQLDYTRSVAGTSLLSGRTQTAVQAAITSPPTGVNLSQDVTSTGNFDTATPPATTQAVPISMVNKVGGTTYTVTTFIDQCYLTSLSTPDCNSAVTSFGWLYRITVDVNYQLGGGRSCAANQPCFYVASTLRDPGSDPCFNVNVAYAGCSTLQPTITAISPNTATTNSSTTITLTGSNFDPGATVSLDTGGTVSNVNRISATVLTFTLTTSNTPAAVGTRTVKLTNPNGKFAYGTLTITTSAISVKSVSPSPVYAGVTSTLTISGSGFQSGSVVSIPSPAGTIVGTPTITSNTITLGFAAASSGSAIGTWPATVTNPDGNSGSANFTIQQAPITLTAVSPSSTLSFTLTGTGFNSGAQVTLDNGNVNETWVSSTTLTVALTSDPAGGSHTFTVTNPDGGNASKSFTVKAPTITNVGPDSVKRNTTNTFTITSAGNDFVPGTATVTLSGGISETISGVTATAGQVQFNYTTTNTRKTYSVYVQVTFSDGSTSNVYPWSLTVTK